MIAPEAEERETLRPGLPLRRPQQACPDAASLPAGRDVEMQHLANRAVPREITEDAPSGIGSHKHAARFRQGYGAEPGGNLRLVPAFVQARHLRRTRHAVQPGRGAGIRRTACAQGDAVQGPGLQKIPAFPSSSVPAGSARFSTPSSPAGMRARSCTSARKRFASRAERMPSVRMRNFPT